MDEHLLKTFKELLMEEKKGKEEYLYSDKIGLGSSIKDETGELSSYDNHPGDLGTETFEAEKNFSFRNNYKTILKLIDTAIKKIDDNKYGFCEICNKSIDIERLKVIPYATLCIECEKSFKNSSNSEKRRPIEEAVIGPPFGRSFRDNSIDDNIQFDGEDTWQAVNVYNVIDSDNPLSKKDSMGYVEDVEAISNEKYKKQLE